MISLHVSEMAIHTIAVIGAGEQGRVIACAALLAGYRTILEDVSENRLAEAAAWIGNTINPGTELHLPLVLMGKIEEAVREADLIVETVADELEMKLEMFTIFDKFARPHALFASTSPSISIAELAAATFCPERCVGVHFVSRAEGGQSLYLVCIPRTSEETVAACRAVGKRMGKEVVLVVDKELTESR